MPKESPTTEDVPDGRTVDDEGGLAGAGTHAFPDEVMQKMTLKVPKAKKNGKLGVRVGRSLHVKQIDCAVPAFKVLRCGDLVLSVNRVKVGTRVQFEEQVKKTPEAVDMCFEVTRARGPLTLEGEKEIYKHVPKAFELLPGFKYMVGYLCLFPGANLGLHVMSLAGKIFVTNAPPNSMAGNVFCVGDSLLTVDDTPVTNIKQCAQAVKEALCRKGWAKAILERPWSTYAMKLTKRALKTQKKLEVDPKMADDVRSICESAISGLKSESGSTTAKGILTKRPKGSRRSRPKGKKKTTEGTKETKQITIADKAEEIPVGCDPYLQEMLEPCKKQRKSKERVDEEYSDED